MDEVIADYLGQAILKDLFEREQHTGNDYNLVYTAKEISEFYMENILEGNLPPYETALFPVSVIEDTLRELERQSLVIGYHDPLARSRYSISSTGRDHLVALGQDSSSIVHRYIELGNDWQIEVLTNLRDRLQNPPDATTSDSIPAADRYVTLDDNDPQVEAARESVSQLIQAVENERSNDFEDKDGILAELRLLELSFRQQTVSVPLVEKILRETVSMLAVRFADHAIGNLANAVWAAAGYLVGIS